MKIRQLKEDEVAFLETTEPEHIPVRGNFMCTDDPESDRRDEDELIRRLDSGDESAWCMLVVKAQWGSYTGYASLGGYSFPSGNSGIENKEYAADDYAELRAVALEDLNKTILAAWLELSDLEDKSSELKVDTKIKSIQIDRTKWVYGSECDEFEGLWIDGRGDIVAHLLNIRGANINSFIEQPIDQAYKQFKSIIPEFYNEDGEEKIIMHDIFQVNDKRDMPQEEREKELIHLFDSIGIELGFFN